LKTYKINYIFKNLSIKNRYPKTELIYSNHFTFLVSVILSAQSTDVAVNKATKKLFRIAKNPEQFINLGEKKLKQYIKSIGLFNSKAKNIIKLSKILKEQYNSKVPSRFEELINLPGVGNKTASVFQNVILNEPRIAVDTHVFRVSNRIGLVEENTPDKTQLALEKTVPKNWKMSAHHLLIFHGRYICKSQKPLCKDCYIKSFCEYKNKNL
tara:strand:+ start:18823 stop:19455 length:633 start_codon:yes stop_codon:yes gene_type:complete